MCMMQVRHRYGLVCCLRHRQQGLSLIELMVGLVIGLILLAGVAQTMLASKEASSSRQNLSVITENARFLFDYMSRDLRMAGRLYDEDAWPEASGTKLEPVAYDTGSDLTLRFFAFDSSNDPIFIVATYSQAADANGANNVMYSRKVYDVDDSTTPWTVDMSSASGVLNPEVLIDRMSGLGFEFGVFDDQGDSDQSNDTYTYVNATGVSGAWDDVVSVRIFVTFEDLGEGLADALPSRAISQTVALRNRVANVIPYN